MKSLSNQTKEQTTDQPYVVQRSFDDFDLHATLRMRLAEKGYDKPTEIQDRSYEAISDGTDFLGMAQTGTGKTAAFLLPLANRLLQKPFKTLVIVPTRELAGQIQVEFKSLTKGLDLFSTCLIGGTNLGKDISNLKKKNHLIIGTPGRLVDLSDRGILNLDEFNVLVLDEFDRLLDMGFSKDINKLVGAMRNKQQTLLFSATIEKHQQALIDNLLKTPKVVKINTGRNTTDTVDQKFINVTEGQDKFDVLNEMLLHTDFTKVLVFAETKRAVSKLCKGLNKNGIRADEIHGNKTQNYRQNALNKFKKGKVKVLVATDVAARGLDIDNVTHVINYQIPQTVDSYIHRVGRTGRAGKSGKAYTFVN